MKDFFQWLTAQIVVGMIKHPVLIPLAILAVGIFLGAGVLAGIQALIR